jgi:hypothetical protein
MTLIESELGVVRKKKWLEKTSFGYVRRNMQGELGCVFFTKFLGILGV